MLPIYEPSWKKSFLGKGPAVLHVDELGRIWTSPPENWRSIGPGVESTNVMQSKERNKTLRVAICSSGPRLKRTGAKFCTESGNP